MKHAFLFLFTLLTLSAQAQTGTVRGVVREAANGQTVPSASVGLKGTGQGTTATADGAFELKSVPAGRQILVVSAVGFGRREQVVEVKAGQTTTVKVALAETGAELGEVVVSGTLLPVTRLQSPVPVEVYSAAYFKQNPTPSIFEALQTVNGVRPQLNCNVCNTGDIHVNGLEGPYTMVLLDGMPIVSGLSTVYGLSGIPTALIERVEVVKGPASTLYGSEAVGGLLNIITRNPAKAATLSADFMTTSWGEHNLDLGARHKSGKVTSLLGLNGFFYDKPRDDNGDGFTDVALARRGSVFNKLTFDRPGGQVASLAGRYMYENRWGGQVNWKPEHRGGDSLYAESIYTNRLELLSAYELKLPEGAPKVVFSSSLNTHRQNSVYGTTIYQARQDVAFGQLTATRVYGRHALLTGTALRFTYYDDNTPATATPDGRHSQPGRTWLPGLFGQDEWHLTDRHTLLLGARYDYHSTHGHILTPRVNFKYAPDLRQSWRLGLGNGYRVVNLFTEEHAALTGARTVVVREQLKPERSWNVNVNYQRRWPVGAAGLVEVDASAFYTYFTNKIAPDYLTDPNLLIYDNLRGHAVSRGLTLNADLTFGFPLKATLGATVLDVYQVRPDPKTGTVRRQNQLLTERVSGTFAVGYNFRRLGLMIDYTGNLYGPMPLPLLSSLDPRPAYSPTYSLQNVQLTKLLGTRVELYGGLKNLLNFRPRADAIARSNDPFDKQVQLDANGQVLATAQNPYALTFDPSYVFAPNQGRRAFVGVRFSLP